MTTAKKGETFLPPGATGAEDAQERKKTRGQNRHLHQERKDSLLSAVAAASTLLHDGHDRAEATQERVENAAEMMIQWEFVPLMPERDASEECSTGQVIIDFNTSICSLFFGTLGHQRFFNSLWRYRRLVTFSAFIYSASLYAIWFALLLGETAGSYLSIFALVSSLPGLVQAILCLNPFLIRSSIPNVQFWVISLLVVAMWTTAGIMLGGIRGVILSIIGTVIDFISGPLRDSYHYRFRSSAASFWRYLVGFIYHAVLAGSMVFKVFRGGRVLRWSLGSRELTGEDIVVHSAGTIVVYMVQWLIHGLSSIKRRLHDRKRKGAQSKDAQQKKRIIRCSTLQWPLVIRPRSCPRTQQSPSSLVQQVTSDQPKGPAEGAARALVPLIISAPKAFSCSMKRTTSLSLPGRTDEVPFSFDIISWRGPKPFFKKVKPTPGDEQTRRKSSASSSFAGEGKNNKILNQAQAGQRERSQASIAPSLRRTLLQTVVALGVCMIPAALYLGSERRSCQQQCDSDSWLFSSQLLASVVLLWNSLFFIYVCSLINMHMLGLMCRSSFDLWFLLLQTLALLFSLCDAFDYDERCMVMLSWSLLYVGCLISDAILPAPQQRRQGEQATTLITKPFLGFAVLLPLLATQCWFLYDLFFRNGSLHLRSRTIFHVTKYLEDGVAVTQGSTLAITTDSFIIARLTSIIVFSLPLLYHLVISCSSSSFSLFPSVLHSKASPRQPTTADLPPPHDRSHEDDKSNRKNELPLQLVGPSTPLYFITGSVSYEAPLRNNVDLKGKG